MILTWSVVGGDDGDENGPSLWTGALNSSRALWRAASAPIPSPPLQPHYSPYYSKWHEHAPNKPQEPGQWTVADRIEAKLDANLINLHFNGVINLGLKACFMSLQKSAIANYST